MSIPCRYCLRDQNFLSQSENLNPTASISIQSTPAYRTPGVDEALYSFSTHISRAIMKKDPFQPDTKNEQHRNWLNKISLRLRREER